MIIPEANKLLAREKFGISANVNLTLASVLVLKEQLKQINKCRIVKDASPHQ